MIDRIETFQNSLIQHGPHNDRVYLMKLADADMPKIVEDLEGFARQSGFGKIFAKIPIHHKQPFLEKGFQQEGSVPDFYRGSQDAVFLGFYLAESRRQETRPDLVTEILQVARQKSQSDDPVSLPGDLICRVAGLEDLEAMARLYQEVFASYPFPIHRPDYLRQTMLNNVIYFGVWEGTRLIALSSAEMDPDAGNAEMTDFATLPECRGRGIAQHLLQEMESEMAGRGLHALYTIARAYSHGMNITFAKNGYHYSGTLTNNTNISGNMESMNIWHKPLRRSC